MKRGFNIRHWVMTMVMVLGSLTGYAQTPTTDLTTHQPTDSPPLGATFEWHTGTAPSSPLVTTPTAVAPGLYYGFYNDGSGCFSEPSPLRVMTNTCATTTVDLNNAAEAPPAGSVLSFHSALPVSDANEITGTGITQAGAATYYVAYKTTVNGASCYSESSPIVVVLTLCCIAGDVAPSLSMVVLTNNCLATTVNLTTAVSLNGSVPSGTTLTWHSATPATLANKITTNLTAIGAGTYYAAFEDALNNCYSPTQEVLVTILSCNTAPLAVNDIAVTPEGKPVSGNVLTNDTDPDGTPLTVITTPIVPPTKGTVVLNPDGTYTYTPTSGQTGEDKFCYAVTDGSLEDTACVTINIVPNPTLANDKPIANDDNTQTTMNVPVLVNVKSNDTDPDGVGTLDTPAPLSTTTEKGGTIVNNNDGTVTYTPPTGFVGKDSVQYKICDTGVPSLCDTAWVTIEVLPTAPAGNQAPVSVDDAALTNVGTPVTIPVKSNDSDPDGGTLGSPSVVNAPTNGTVVVNPDGTVTYTPTSPTFTGSDVFTYKVCDNGTPSKCDTATVVVSVEPIPNTAPLAVNDIAVTPEGKPVSGNVLTNDTDPDGTPLTVITTPIVPPTKGTVVLNPDGTYTYTPTSGQTGEDKFCYAVTDGSLEDTACVTINIVPNPTLANDKPIANDDNTQTTMNVPVLVNVKSNDTDPDGVGTLDTPAPLSTTTEKGGTIVNNNDGTVTYTPPTGFVGKDSVQYKICDTGVPSLCDTAWVTIEVLPTAPAGNQAPVSVDDAALTNVGTPVTIPVKSNDSDPDGGTLGSPSVVNAPTNGTVVVNPDGTVTYTPTSPTFTGSDVFTYKVCDNGTPSKCDTATVVVSVEPIPNAPVIIANSDIAATIAGSLVNIPVLINDTNNGVPAILTNVTAPTIIANPTKGTLTVKADGSIDYTPNANTSGSDTFIYQICDKLSTTTCDTALMTINIGLKLSPRAYLLGCYNETTDLMHDSLRRKNLIPLTQPYVSDDYSDNAYTGTETTTSGVFAVTGNNAIVDWVMVELRNPLDPKIIVAKRAALIQRDGDIVDVDGISPVMFGSMTPASYYVSVKHRNHLGVLTAIPQALTFVPKVVDFTLTTLDNYKTTSLDKDFAQKPTTNSKRAMWMGNIKNDNAVIFQGPSNDVSELYLKVLTDLNNSSFLANYILNGYLRGDVDMDGKTIYQGPNNEVDKIFFEVLLHPFNTTYLYNFIINEQIPR